MPMDDDRRTGSCCGPQVQPPTASPCCGSKAVPGRNDAGRGRPLATLVLDSVRTDKPWIEGIRITPAGGVPRVTTKLTVAGRLSGWRARWAIGRMGYAVAPGLYAVGRPAPESPVFVSANYKMSFDRLRASLDARDGWILVLDTKGINVWCAAGKGTFGTDELVQRAEAVRLDEIVSHNVVIVPQLGATGVSAHEVKRRSGLRVVYGPVRAEDLPGFLDAGMTATAGMRRVRFDLRDRLVVAPVQLMMSLKYALIIAVLFVLLSGLGSGGYSLGRVSAVGLWSAVLFLGAYVVGIFVVPALLPWLPGRAFSTKGASAGIACGAVALAVAPSVVFGNWPAIVGWLLFLAAVTSFNAMNFTGASTYTSLSGVRREMRVAVPLQISFAVLGVVLLLVGRFV